MQNAEEVYSGSFCPSAILVSRLFCPLCVCMCVCVLVCVWVCIGQIVCFCRQVCVCMLREESVPVYESVCGGS